MKPVGTTKQLEQRKRRRKAIALLKQGNGVRQTARMVGVTGGAVCQWKKAYGRLGQGFMPSPLPRRNRWDSSFISPSDSGLA